MNIKTGKIIETRVVILKVNNMNNDEQTIKKVLESLKDESLLDSIDRRINQWRRSYRKTYRNLHPLDSLCTAAVLLFLRYSNHPQDFDVYITNPFLMDNETVKGSIVQVTMQHYFLKNRKTGEIIDPTFEQFQGKISLWELYNNANKCFLVFFNGTLRGLVCGPLPVSEMHSEIAKRGMQLAA